MSNTPLHVYEIDDGETWHYIARSAEHALHLFVSEIYYPTSVVEYVEEHPETKVTQCPDDKIIKIRLDADGFHEEDYTEAKTCAEWVRENGGEGLLWSTVW